MTRSERNAYSRNYYKKNPSYRKKRIKDRKEYYKENQKSENKRERERYWSDEDYRRYKIRYARNYRKTHKK